MLYRTQAHFKKEKPEVALRLEKPLRTLIQQGFVYFGAGGALGFDTLAAQTVLALKKEFPDIRLILVLPCLAQTNGWPPDDVVVYNNIKQQADKVVYTSKEYDRQCMFKRNRHLVDNSHVCICYLTKSTGGTAYTVRYALDQGLRIINVASPCKEGGLVLY